MPPSTPATPAVPSQDVLRDEQAGSVGSAPAGSAHSPIRKTVRDIALSMGIVAAIIAVAMIVSWRPQPDPVRQVDARPVAEAVAAVADFGVLYPNVGADWRATSARYEATEESGDEPVWFNGWVTPDSRYVAVVQSAATAQDFVTEQTIEGREPRIGGPAQPEPGWTAYLSRDGEQRSLVRRTPTGTTIVTGSVAWDGLVDFRDTLVEVGPAGRR